MLQPETSSADVRPFIARHAACTALRTIDRCKDYVINAYVTGEEYFAVDCVQNSKYDWCPRVRDWVLEAQARQAREYSTGSLGHSGQHPPVWQRTKR